MKKIITFGEIMLRLSPPGHQRLCQASQLEVVYGGGESNVAVSLAHFGLPVEYVTRLPDNDLGECVLTELRRWGVGTRHVLRGGERLGLYFYEKGAGHRNGKVLYDRANSSLATLQPGKLDWDSIFEDAGWFHWTGITPAISQSAADACQEALQVASRKGVYVSFDLSYRKNLWKYGKPAAEVLPELMRHCDLILCGMEDAAQHFGIFPLKNEPSVLSVCKQLFNRFPQAKKVVMPMRTGNEISGQQIAAVLFDGEQFLETPALPVAQIIDRVGSGDAFMAGLIYGLLTYGDDQQALHFANAAACLKHSIPGDMNLVTVAEVEALVAGDAGGRVVR